MVDETLVSYEYHYWVSFGQILKMAYFRLIFGRFPLIKSQNQNPMLLSVNFWDKTLIFGVWFPYIQRDKTLIFGVWFPHIHRQLDLNGRVTKMNFTFLGTPYCAPIPHKFCHVCIKWVNYRSNDNYWGENFVPPPPSLVSVGQRGP